MTWSQDPCYDFPELILHGQGGKCPRYTGGVCKPLPAPSREDNPAIWESYENMLAIVRGEQKPSHPVLGIRPKGNTQTPDGTVYGRGGGWRHSALNGTVCPNCGNELKPGQATLDVGDATVHQWCFRPEIVEDMPL